MKQKYIDFLTAKLRSVRDSIDSDNKVIEEVENQGKELEAVLEILFKRDGKKLPPKATNGFLIKANELKNDNEYCGKGLLVDDIEKAIRVVEKIFSTPETEESVGGLANDLIMASDIINRLGQETEFKKNKSKNVIKLLLADLYYVAFKKTYVFADKYSEPKEWYYKAYDIAVNIQAGIMRMYNDNWTNCDIYHDEYETTVKQLKNIERAQNVVGIIEATELLYELITDANIDGSNWIKNYIEKSMEKVIDYCLNNRYYLDEDILDKLREVSNSTNISPKNYNRIRSKYFEEKERERQQFLTQKLRENLTIADRFFLAEENYYTFTQYPYIKYYYTEFAHFIYRDAREYISDRLYNDNNYTIDETSLKKLISDYLEANKNVIRLKDQGAYWDRVGYKVYSNVMEPYYLQLYDSYDKVKEWHSECHNDKSKEDILNGFNKVANDFFVKGKVRLEMYTNQVTDEEEVRRLMADYMPQIEEKIYAQVDSELANKRAEDEKRKRELEEQERREREEREAKERREREEAEARRRAEEKRKQEAEEAERQRKIKEREVEEQRRRDEIAAEKYRKEQEARRKREQRISKLNNDAPLVIPFFDILMTVIYVYPLSLFVNMMLTDINILSVLYIVGDIVLFMLIWSVLRAVDNSINKKLYKELYEKSYSSGNNTFVWIIKLLLVGFTIHVVCMLKNTGVIAEIVLCIVLAVTMFLQGLVYGKNKDKKANK